MPQIMSSSMQQNHVDGNASNWSPSGLYDVVLRSQHETESQKNYDLWATEYDGDNARMGYAVPLEVAKLCTKYVTNSETTTLLDVGAGTGELGTYLRKNEKFIGEIDILDANMEMLYLASKKNLRFRNIIRHWIKGEIPLPSNSYDVIASLGAFLPLHLPPSALQNLLTLTKVGGIIIFNVRKSISGSYIEDLQKVVDEMQENNLMEIVEKKEILHVPKVNAKVSVLYVCRKIRNS